MSAGIADATEKAFGVVPPQALACVFFGVLMFYHRHLGLIEALLCDLCLILSWQVFVGDALAARELPRLILVLDQIDQELEVNDVQPVNEDRQEDEQIEQDDELPKVLIELALSIMVCTRVLVLHRRDLDIRLHCGVDLASVVNMDDTVEEGTAEPVHHTD